MLRVCLLVPSESCLSEFTKELLSEKDPCCLSQCVNFENVLLCLYHLVLQIKAVPLLYVVCFALFLYYPVTRLIKFNPKFSLILCQQLFIVFLIESFQLFFVVSVEVLILDKVCKFYCLPEVVDFYSVLFPKVLS